MSLFFFFIAQLLILIYTDCSYYYNNVNKKNLTLKDVSVDDNVFQPTFSLYGFYSSHGQMTIITPRTF